MADTGPEWENSVTKALLIIDIQNDYFPGGGSPLVGPEAAAQVAGTVLQRFRQDNQPVIHVQHVWDDPEAGYMRPGTTGVEIHSAVTPLEHETIIVKTHPNAFLETNLSEKLKEGGIDELVVMGMMTSVCIDATVRAAVDSGLSVTVVADACAAPDLTFRGRTVAAADVHAAFLAALAGHYADVITSAELVV
nr:cysteine hydrolase family protein [Nakamurella sp. PAMC28650]